jgi:DNA-directed RNA polymerase specialized sigma24 family protein
MKREINDWINNNYETLHNNASRITSHPDKSSDLLHICLESFIRLPESRQQQMFDDSKIEHFITSCCNLQFKSSTSPYYYQYRKQSHNENEYVDWIHDSVELEPSDYDEWCDCVFQEMDNLHWYTKRLVDEKYIQGLTYDDLHKKYNINKNALLRDIHSGVDELREKCLPIKK